MENQICKAAIAKKLSSLSNAEAKVAEYVLENYEDVLNYNVSELAEKAGSSDASVVRFCKSVGYKGYHDFKINLAKDVIPPYKHLNQELEEGDGIETVCSKVFNAEISTLNETLSYMDFGMASRAVEAIKNAQHVEIYGSGGSLLIGMDAQHKLMKIGIKAFAVPDADLQAMSSSLLQKGDVALCISHSGSNRLVMNCMELANQNGATTIALTTQGKSPMSRMADITLSVVTKQTVFKSESVSARIGQLALLDAIIAKISVDNYSKSYDAIQKTRKATSNTKY